jgi:anti-anti-sigma regulatory factor
MDIVISHAQGRVPVTIFHLSGPFISDTQLVPRAQSAYEEGVRDILLDLSNVDYISSQGLRALHTIYTLLRSDAPAESDEAVKVGIRSGTFTSPHLKLLNPSPKVVEVLHMTGYDMFLGIYRDRNAAIAAF